MAKKKKSHKFPQFIVIRPEEDYYLFAGTELEPETWDANDRDECAVYKLTEIGRYRQQPQFESEISYKTK